MTNDILALCAALRMSERELRAFLVTASADQLRELAKVYKHLPAMIEDPDLPSQVFLDSAKGGIASIQEMVNAAEQALLDAAARQRDKQQMDELDQAKLEARSGLPKLKPQIEERAFNAELEQPTLSQKAIPLTPNEKKWLEICKQSIAAHNNGTTYEAFCHFRNIPVETERRWRGRLTKKGLLPPTL